jgi:Family of unknown function (DUF6159)
MFTRMKQGWELTKKAWSVVRQHPSLARLPLTGGVLAVVTALVLIGPGLFLASADQNATRGVGYVLIALGAYLASFLVIYYNVILAAAANDALEGREPDVAAARQVAKNRIPTIAGWALVSALVSITLGALRDRGGFAGQIAASIGAALWGLVTFLVIPVIALEGIGPIDAIKRSGSLVKGRWGQQVTGNFVIGGVATLVTIVGVVGVAGGVALIASASTWIVLGAALVVVGLVVAVGGAVFGGATRGVFGVALYHFVAEDRALGPFTSAELATIATPTR